MQRVGEGRGFAGFDGAGEEVDCEDFHGSCGGGVMGVVGVVWGLGVYFLGGGKCGEGWVGGGWWKGR